MKFITSVFLCLIMLACSSVNRINYTPDISDVKNPISTIKTTLEQQPPAYAYLPVKVEVTEQCMTLYLNFARKLP